MGDTMNQDEQFVEAAVAIAQEKGYVTLRELFMLREAVASVALSQPEGKDTADSAGLANSEPSRWLPVYP